MQDEQNKLENFLKEANIDYDRNYVRMEKGPEPFFYKALTFSYQIRFTILEFYYLVFTCDSIILSAFRQKTPTSRNVKGVAQ